MGRRELLASLYQVLGSLDLDADELLHRLDQLSARLQEVVSGFAGLRLTVVYAGHPVVLDATTPERAGAAVTSLGVPLPLLHPVHEAGGRIVVYSTVAGALVDLAADLAYVLHRGSDSGGGELDADLPLVPQPALTGLDDLAVLSRAAGILIDQGEHPDAVYEVLRGRARASGVSPLALATQLLAR